MVDVQRPRRWQERDYTFSKLVGVALASFAPSFVAPCSAILAPAVVMFIFAFFEQRPQRHIVPGLLATVATLFGIWLHDNGLMLAALLMPVVYAPLLFLPAMVGSMCGLPVSRSCYTIVNRKRGRCPGCGYCLTGLPRQVCPECGRPFDLAEVGMDDEIADSAEGEDTPSRPDGPHSP